MDTLEWILVNVLTALFWLWVHKGSGAYWLEKWQGAFMMYPWWTSDQLRTYAFFLLLIQALLFILGMISSENRYGPWF